MVPSSSGLGRRCFSRRRFLYSRRSLGEFETDFAFFQFQMRGERTAFFGNEFREQIGYCSGGRDR
jgi:hypothetical protein